MASNSLCIVHVGCWLSGVEGRQAQAWAGVSDDVGTKTGRLILELGEIRRGPFSCHQQDYAEANAQISLNV